MRWRFGLFVTLFAVLPVVIGHSSIWALDRRHNMKLSRFEFGGSVYGLYEIEICPNCWDGQPLTDTEILRFHAISHALVQVQDFLYETHRAQSDSPMNQFILNSFLIYPDPYGRFRRSDSIRPLRKVDDYFNHHTLILVLAKDGDLSHGKLIGTAKFVVSNSERLQAPLIQQFQNFFPMPLTAASLDKQDPQKPTDIEYENLARTQGGPNPIPLLLKTAADSSFFASLRGRPSHTHLNCVDDLVDYHRKFGFFPVEGYYPGLPAHRMTGDTWSFLETVRAFVEEKMSKGDPQILTPQLLRLVDWEKHGATPLSAYTQPGSFERLFCDALLERDQK